MATETVINRPAPFVEDIGKKLSEQALGLQNVPVVTTGVGGITRAAGETDQGFADRQNAARAFEVRQQNLAGLKPEVAPKDTLQNLAELKALQGVGSFKPFLQRAETEAQLASGLGTTALGQLGTAGSQLGIAGTTLGGVPLGAQSFQQDVSQFMSPYQQQVIDVSLAEFDRNKQMQEQQYEINKQNWVRSAVVERECNSLSLAQGQQENEHYYKQDFCNKVFNKLKELDNKTYKIDLVLAKRKQD